MIVRLTERCRAIGRISKVQGINGELVVITNSIIDESITKTELVFLNIDGLPVPFFISSLDERTDKCLVMGLQEVKTRKDAEALVGCEVLIEESKKKGRKKKAQIDTSLLSYTVVDDNHGTLGTISEVISSDMNPLIQIMSKGKEILIPLHEDIILEINDDEKTIRINAPEGLLDLN